MTLKTALSCEIDDLATEIISISNKTYDEVEDALLKLGIYPENTKTFLMISTKDDIKNIITDFSREDYPELKWVDDTLLQIFENLKIYQIYVTNAI